MPKIKKLRIITQHKRMAKRHTDTDKWKKEFLRSLPAEYKLFWLYLTDECDHAGIWHVELSVAEDRLGMKLSLKKMQGLAGDRIVAFDNESKWFLPDFISFQYGELDGNNRVHKSVIERLEKYGLIEPLTNSHKTLTRPLQGCKDKHKDKEKDNKGGMGENLAFESIDENGWKQMPKHTDLSLPPDDIMTSIHGMQYQRGNTTISKDDIIFYWDAWVVKEIRGDKIYHSKEEVYRFFCNCCNKINIPKKPKGQQNGQLKSA